MRWLALIIFMSINILAFKFSLSNPKKLSVYQTLLMGSNSQETEPSKSVTDSIRSACRMGDSEKLSGIVSQWINNTVALNDRKGDFMGLTPLHWAVAAGQAKGRKACVQILIDAGADIECVNNGGSTPLMYAAATGKLECMDVLINSGANVNARALTDGQTSLHQSVSRGFDECLLFLIDNGADVEAADNNGDTPLHLATRFGKYDCEKILLERGGANRNAVNNAGKTPYDYNAAEITNFSYE